MDAGLRDMKSKTVKLRIPVQWIGTGLVYLCFSSLTISLIFPELPGQQGQYREKFKSTNPHVPYQ